MPELSLDNRQRDPFVRHFDRVRVRVPELVRRKPPPYTSLGREPAKLATGGSR